MNSLFYGNADDNEKVENPSFSGKQEETKTPSYGGMGTQQPPAASFGGMPQPAGGTYGGMQQQNTFGNSFGGMGMGSGQPGAPQQNTSQQISSIFGQGQMGSMAQQFGQISQGGASDVGFLVQNASSVAEYAYSEDKNRQYRPDMEDTHCHVDKLSNDPSCGLFCIFDGHGGKHVAEHCAEMFPVEMKKEMNKKPQDLHQVFENVFKKIDTQVSMIDSDHCGTTACVAVVRKEINHHVLYVANAGDTRAVLSKNGAAERLSVDHKATEPSEIERVRGLGGKIIDNRVAGGLAITRAIGDHAYQTFGVTYSPYVVRHVLRPFDKYLVIASDGVWDTVNDNQAIALCTEDKNCKEIAQSIIKLSLEKGSADNISCLVLKLNAGGIF